MGVLLGIDYGRRRVGLAISDESESIAQGIDAVLRDKQNKFLQELLEIIKTRAIIKLIIGIPLGYNGKPTQMSNEVVEFASDLKELSGIEYVMWNETSTSEIARFNLRDTGKYNIDSEAARIILQEYLDFKKTGI
jgi:putative holliday junction resolvase